MHSVSRSPLDEREILFVGGKGGVGKTTTASALALQAAERNRKILVVSTDPAHSLGDIFDVSIGNREREILPNLWALEIDPDRQVDAYLAGVKATMREFVRPAMFSEIDRQMELTRQSPGAVEAALMERMAQLMEEGRRSYDQVIFDTAPTGHTLRLLTLPEIMAAWMDGLLKGRDRSDSLGRAVERLSGRRRERSGDSPPKKEGEESERTGDELSWFQQVDESPGDERGRKIREALLARRRTFSRARRHLLDPDITAFILVLIPEKLPILESRKAVDVLRKHRVPIAGMVVNRVLPGESLGDFLESRRSQEEEYLAQIEALFGDLDPVRIPLLRRDVDGLEGLREVARYLEPFSSPSRATS